ncbi:hypothetical protein [Hymenobacter terricola]|uniref:hypothetical protein n=1 Tax=Hymenobacter terricola TaxID=2819236 RepID=UPI001B308814|nr:hypothetical protein [Hymenobacter terricola]
MKPLAKLIGAALLGAFALLAAPAAQAQVGVNINIGAPAWGPQVPYGTQYYYIPEIDGYYDLYTQQYIVYQDGYWVPLPQLYGYDPYQFHPVIVNYRGAQPWLQVSYYRQRYAYQPYRAYGPSRSGYYNGGYGRPGYGYGYDNRGGYSNGRGYGDRDRDNRGGYSNGHGYENHGGDRDNHTQSPGGGYNTPRGTPMPQQPQPQQGGSQGNHGGFGGGQGQPGGGNGGGQQGGGVGGGRGNEGGGRGNGGENHGGGGGNHGGHGRG